MTRSTDGKIMICEPEIGEEERGYVVEAIDEVELSGHGMHVKMFEQRFAEYIGVNHAVMTPNGTIALHLTLASLGVREGDFVILPGQTISSCAFATTSLCARVIVVDVDPETWCMDPGQVAIALDGIKKGRFHTSSEHPKCVIMPVHIFAGVPCDMDQIMEIAEEYSDDALSIYVVEDTCEAFGSSYIHKGVKCLLGSIGDAGCFSFFANKTLQTGEGGMITTNSDLLDQRLRYLRNNGYGADPKNRFWANDQAYNYRPHNLAAAIGLGQLDKVDYLTRRRSEINAWYKSGLVKGFKFQTVPSKSIPVPWMTAVLVPTHEGKPRSAEFMKYMAENGIETRPTFPPLGQHPYINTPAKCHIVSERNTQRIWDSGVILPSGGKHITREVVSKICSLANQFLEGDAEKK